MYASDGRSDPTGLLEEGALPRHGLEGQASDGVLNAVQSGTNGGVDNVDMSQQSHGSSDEQLDSSQQSRQSSDEQLDSSQQSRQSSDEQLEGRPQCPVGRQLTSAELVGGDQAQVGGSSEVSVLSEVALGGRFAKAASSGASASTVQVGGSSSSHGMAALPWPEPCYEDYYGDAMVVDRFPYVGSWRSVHFLLALFSQVGEGVLRALGECVFTWRALRVVSLGLRHGVASALVEVLRRSCWARYFEGPQWQLAVDRYMVTGRVVEGPLALNASLGGQGGVSFEGPVFPYVEGPPGYAFHYLWRVFMLTGCLVLDFLGDRVSSWGYLRSTAEGFRSGATMAVSIWLRRTGQRYIDRYLALTPTTADAVQAYMERGELQFPFAERNEQNPEGTDVEDDEQIDERGFRDHRPGLVAPLGGLGLAGRELFESSSSESVDSGESTTEPSVVSVSPRSSGSERDNGSVGVEPRVPSGVSAVAGLRGLVYEAREEALVCFLCRRYGYSPAARMG